MSDDRAAEGGEPTCPFCGEDDFMVELSETAMDAWAVCNGRLAQGPVVTVGCRDEQDEPIDLEGEAIEAMGQRPGSSGPSTEER